MRWNSGQILDLLDQCAEVFTFPTLDNGYVYLAACRLSAFRSIQDWAIVIEIFGFSPRSGVPDLQICTFASQLANRKESREYVSETAYANYLKNNPNNEMRFVYPIHNEEWMDPENPELLVERGVCLLRKEKIDLPTRSQYEMCGIKLELDSPQVFEFCRYLAFHNRHLVLATDFELRHNVGPAFEKVIQLEDWQHPDVTAGEKPSESSTFRQLAQLLSFERKSFSNWGQGNTHWKNWPEGGTL